MSEKNAAGSKKKNNYFPLIILAIFLLIAGSLLFFFNSNDNDDGSDSGELTDSSDSVSENGESDRNGGTDETDDVNGNRDNNDSDNSSSVIDMGEVFFDEELEKTVYDWITAQIGNEDFVLLLSLNISETPEAYDAYKDDKVFVYRTELSEGGGRSVLIGEPFSDAFFRLEMVKQDGEWIITEEIDLWE